jgi:nucleotide-binding universal stress UspA family protein
MFRNVIVGVERHGGAGDAVALAKELLNADGQLTLAHVYSGEPRPGQASLGRHDAAKLDRIAQLLEGTAQAAGVQAALRWRESTSAGRGLHELCELLGADLLVVGSSRHARLGRVLMRDHTLAALNGAPCAVAVAPRGYLGREPGLHTVGVGYDGSPESQHALQLARALAAEHQATLSALHVVSSPAYSYTGDESADVMIAERLREAREQVAALGGLEAQAVYGFPADELSLYSASVDVLIVGGRGYGPLGRLTHGSVSHQLARTASCPLLVLTRTAHTADAAENGQLETAVA